MANKKENMVKIEINSSLQRAQKRKRERVN